jgi:uncharacterized protein DUF6629
MCYSAEVSYGSAALLIATGGVTTLGNHQISRRMVAAVPFLFGLQQIAEGVVWQTMGHAAESSRHHFGVLLFLLFANVVWPSWIPWSFYFIEPSEKRRRVLKGLGLLGLGVSVVAAWVFFTADARAYVAGHSLAYSLDNVKRFWPVNIEIVFYIAPTVAPFFISSLRIVRRAGYLILASLCLAQVINQETTASVWCFFAALISLYIAVYVLWLERRKVGAAV